MKWVYSCILLDPHYLQEANIVLHVSQPAQFLTPPMKLCHLLLESVNLALHVVSQAAFTATKELTDLSSGFSQVFDQLGENT